MPGPAAVVAVPASILALKRLVLQASIYYTPEVATATSIAAITTIIAKFLWKQTPEWIRQDISFRSLFRRRRSSDKEETREELTHLSSVLQSVHRYIKSMENTVQVPQLGATILAYVQWSKQMKEDQREKKDDSRDLAYEATGDIRGLEQVRTFKHQQALRFATWAYHHDSSVLIRLLQEQDHELIFQDASTRPGYVAFYVAVSGIRKEMVIGIRGTSTLEDLVTDCCGHTVVLQHEADEDEKSRVEVEAARSNEIRLSQRSTQSTLDEIWDYENECNAIYEDDIEIISGHEKIMVEDGDHDQHTRCHEGILVSSKRLCRRIQPLIQDWVIDAGYTLNLCGHSLGAGAATLTAVMLKKRYPEIERRLQVHAFAPPPVLDHDSAIAAAPFVTSFVNNADLIPRCSVFNLTILLQGLKRMSERLDERGINPIGPTRTAAFVRHIFSSYRTTSDNCEKENERDIVGKELEDGCEERDLNIQPPANKSPVDKSLAEAKIDVTPLIPLLTWNEWHSALAEGTPEVRKAEHLFVAGRVYLFYCPWRNNEVERDIEISHIASPVQMKCVETDGTSLALRSIEVDSSRLFTDHVTSAYYEALGMVYTF